MLNLKYQEACGRCPQLTLVWTENSQTRDSTCHIATCDTSAHKGSIPYPGILGVSILYAIHIVSFIFGKIMLHMIYNSIHLCLI